MARIRTIKPELWSDEKFVELSPWARLLFVGLWNFADDEGRMEYSDKRLKMQIFPGDQVQVSRLVEELKRIRIVQLYSVDGRSYLALPNFKKHQRVNRPNPSRLPAPDDSLSSQEPLSELQDSEQQGDAQAVQQVWDYYIATIGKNPKVYTFTDKRKRIARARLDDLLSRVAEPKLENAVALMKLCIDRLAGSAFHAGQNEQHKRYQDWEILFRSTDQMERWLDDSRFEVRQ